MAKLGEFQSAPCNYLVYKRLLKNKMTELGFHRVCTVIVTDLSWDLSNGANNLQEMYGNPVRIVTNATCAPTTNVYHTVNGRDTIASISVDTLTEFNAEAEIDPRMLEEKLPNATVKFRVRDFNDKTPLNTINEFIDATKNKMFCVMETFTNKDFITRDSYGQFNADFGSNMGSGNANPSRMSDFVNHSQCLGYYVAEDVDYDFETNEMTISGTDLTFKNMHENLFFSKASAMYPTSEIVRNNVARPYPYAPITLSFNWIKCVTGNVSGGEYYDYRCTFFRRQFPWEEHKEQVIDLKHTVGLHTALLKATAKDASDYVAWGAINPGITQQPKPAEEGNFDFTDDENMAPYCYFLHDESIYDVIKTGCLMNNLWILPTMNVPTTFLQYKLQSANYNPGNGNWQIVGGRYPSEYPFYGKIEGDPTTQLTMGKWYPTRAEKYKIYPNMILEKSRKKMPLELTEVKYAKKYNIQIDTSFTQETDGNVTVTTMTGDNKFLLDLKEHDTVGAALTTIEHTLGQNRYRVTYDYYDLNELPEGKWYDLHSGDKSYGEVMGLNNTTYVGRMPSAEHTTSAANKALAVPLLGRNVVNPKKFYDQGFTIWKFNAQNKTADKKPFRFQLRAVDPTSVLVDRNDNPVSQENVENDSTIDTLHLYSGTSKLAARMIDRANLTDCKPLYKLSWTMLDDPFLRVGTLVYVPLQNLWVKVLITKQVRSFDGTAKLYCEGLVTEETAEQVMNPNLLDAAMTYYSEPTLTHELREKGEMLLFTWTLPPEMTWEPQTVSYSFYLRNKNTGVGVLLGRSLVGNAEGQYQYFNVPEIEERLGFKFDATGSTYTPIIKATFGSFGLSSENVCTYVRNQWNNENYSMVPAGYVRASNEHQPLIAGNLLQG